MHWKIREQTQKSQEAGERNLRLSCNAEGRLDDILLRYSKSLAACIREYNLGFQEAEAGEISSFVTSLAT